jgi:hypothetical protein
MTLEELGALVNGLGEKLTELDTRVSKRLNDQSAILDEVRKPRTDPDGKPKGELDGEVDKRLKAIEEGQAKIDADRAALARKRVEGLLAEALVKAGVPETQARDLAAIEVIRKPERYNLTADDAVEVKEGDTVLSRDQWVDVFLDSDRGRSYLPASRTPMQDPAGDGGGKGKTGGSHETMTPEKMEAGDFNPETKASAFRYKER